jgi:hypothetical protein
LSQEPCEADEINYDCIWVEKDNACDKDWEADNPSNGGGSDDGGGGLDDGCGDDDGEPNDGLDGESACLMAGSETACIEILRPLNSTVRMCKWGNAESEDSTVGADGGAGSDGGDGDTSTTDESDSRPCVFDPANMDACLDRSVAECNATASDGTPSTCALRTWTRDMGGGIDSTSEPFCSKEGSVGLPCSEVVEENSCTALVGTNGAFACVWQNTTTDGVGEDGGEEDNSCFAFDFCSVHKKKACATADWCTWTEDCSFNSAWMEDLSASIEDTIGIDAHFCSELGEEACTARNVEEQLEHQLRCTWNDNSLQYCMGADESTEIGGEFAYGYDDSPDVAGSDNDDTISKVALQAAFCGTTALQGSADQCKKAMMKNATSPSCRWVVDSGSSVCSEWEHCQGRNDTQTEAGCLMREGCGWYAKYHKCTDIHHIPTSTTATTTTISQACSSHRFKCTKEFQCIIKAFECDGAPDCSDGTDEEDCGFTTKTTTTKTTHARTKRSTKTKTTPSITASAGDKESTVKTTTQTTKTDSSSSSSTATTTTMPNCVLEGQCDSIERYQNALVTRDPKYTTPAECRACALDGTLAEVCAKAKTIGCNALKTTATTVTATTPAVAVKEGGGDGVTNLTTTTAKPTEDLGTDAPSADQSSSHPPKNKGLAGGIFGTIIAVALIAVFVLWRKSTVRAASDTNTAKLREKMVGDTGLSAYANPVYGNPKGGGASVAHLTDEESIVYQRDDANGAGGQGGDRIRGGNRHTAGGAGPRILVLQPVAAAAAAPSGRRSPPGGASTMTLGAIDEGTASAGVEQPPVIVTSGIAPVLNLGSGGALDATLEC